MTESYKTLKKWFISMINQFNDVVFMYEYDGKHKTHYIAVVPYDKFANDSNYCKCENEFFDIISDKYPDETFLFGKDGFNFKMSNDCKIFGFILSYKKSYPIEMNPLSNIDYNKVPLEIIFNKKTLFKKGHVAWHNRIK
ncbi:MAG: hypothetical protein LBJ63_02595 [Prevotellaceae bacterium]|jgi:hypothetical protein|nr:hypothetical protein [Prevotellaceae bacterium]